MQSHSTRTPSFPTNLEDYAPWVATYGLTAPYGECQCGCGKAAPISSESNTRNGYAKGEPKRFIRGGHYLQHLTLEDAFWQYVSPGGPDECWEWQKVLSIYGYGVVRFRNKIFVAHRASWIICYGPIPDGMFVCHKCDNRACVNPAHLFVGTHTDNMRDMIAKGRNSAPPSTRLTHADVDAIRKLKGTGIYQREVAARYGVSQKQISRIWLGKAWAK